MTGRGPMRDYYVYIMSNVSRRLYVGVTNDLERRVYEHRSKIAPSFSKRYNITLLVYVEPYPDPRQAIEREKQLKSWSCAKKVALIERMNPEWIDLSGEWRGG
jgi:putative endonuclease